MPTRQFHSADPKAKAALLDAAAVEFAEHGFANGSLNRVIAAAGLSKSTVYRWFDDKADLYRTVMRLLVDKFVAVHAASPLPVVDPESFWAEVHRQWRLTLQVYAEWPPAAGLVRSLAHGAFSGDPAGALAQTTQTVRAMIEATVRVGQAVGAIRTDLPFDLVLALATSTSDAVDVWLAEHPEVLADPEASAQLAADLTDLMRRMARPREE